MLGSFRLLKFGQWFLGFNFFKVFQIFSLGFDRVARMRKSQALRFGTFSPPGLCLKKRSTSRHLFENAPDWAMDVERISTVPFHVQHFLKSVSVPCRRCNQNRNPQEMNLRLPEFHRTSQPLYQYPKLAAGKRPTQLTKYCQSSENLGFSDKELQVRRLYPHPKNRIVVD